MSNALRIRIVLVVVVLFGMAGLSVNISSANIGQQSATPAATQPCPVGTSEVHGTHDANDLTELEGTGTPEAVETQGADATLDTTASATLASTAVSTDDSVGTPSALGAAAGGVVKVSDDGPCDDHGGRNGKDSAKGNRGKGSNSGKGKSGVATAEGPDDSGHHGGDNSGSGSGSGGSDDNSGGNSGSGSSGGSDDGGHHGGGDG